MPSLGERTLQIKSVIQEFWLTKSGSSLKSYGNTLLQENNIIQVFVVLSLGLGIQPSDDQILRQKLSNVIRGEPIYVATSDGMKIYYSLEITSLAIDDHSWAKMLRQFQ